MYKDEYKNKMVELLDDKNIYRIIRHDPTEKLQKENNNIVAGLYKGECIDVLLKHRLTCSSAMAPRIYGLPKIHKDNTPLRPIVSSTNVPCYQLSKHIGNCLKNIISSKYNIKNSTAVKDKLKLIKLDSDEILVSFDAVSLFTNIPVHIAIRYIMKKWNIIQTFTKIPKTKFLKILTFCLTDNNYFTYNGNIYNQIFGMPMGNPLSPTIADVILDSLLDEALAELEEKNIYVKYIVKYVDDILAIIKFDNKDEILRSLNNFHPKIQFTVEMEKNYKLPYLDMMLQRHENKIIFDWYSKETASNRLMNYNATQPMTQIINMAKNFIFRVLNISDEQFYTININKITNILKQNSFPIKLINNLIYETKIKLKNFDSKYEKTDNNNQQVFFHGVTYIPGLTDNKNLKATMIKEKIKFAYKPNSTLKTIFSNVKDKLKKQKQCNVVYEIKCKGDNEQSCDLIYIGTTKRTLETRLSEHKNDIIKKKETTALSQHILKTGHSPDFETVRILDIESKEKKRYTIESLRIQQNITRTMNLKEDTNNMNASYIVAIK